MAYITNIFPQGIDQEFLPFYEEATRFWNNVLKKGHEPIVLEEDIDASDRCQFDYIIPKGTTINGIAILSGVVDIDGPGQILGQAGVCIYDRSPFAVNPNDPEIFPLVGLMKFDKADVRMLINSGNFLDVVIHEMAHVAGYGVLWGIQYLTVDNCGVFFPGDCDPVYVGEAALEEYRKLGGEGDIPVANTGSLGTINVHWRESTFENELMTGYLNSGIVNPLSRMTIASFIDLGYEVSFEEAQEYAIPSEFARPVNSERIEMIGDIINFEKIGIEEVYEQIRARRVEPERFEREDNNDSLVAVMVIGFLAMGAMMMYMARLQTKALQALAHREGAVTGTKNPML